MSFARLGFLSNKADCSDVLTPRTQGCAWGCVECELSGANITVDEYAQCLRTGGGATGFSCCLCGSCVRWANRTVDLADLHEMSRELSLTVAALADSCFS